MKPITTPSHSPIASSRPEKKERCLYLFICLVLILVLYPYLVNWWGRILLNILFVSAMFAAGYAVANHPLQFRISLILGGGVLIISSAHLFMRYAWEQTNVALMFLSMAGIILFLVYCSVTMLLYIVQAPEVTEDVLFAAVSLYILLGLMWSVLYALVEWFQPGSFHANAPILMENGQLQWPHFLYFSFVTLTTLGYGDITPTTMRAQSVTILESTIGLLYLGVLIARLVGMYKSKSERTSDSA